jgi:hypothetical protein
MYSSCTSNTTGVLAGTDGLNTTAAPAAGTSRMYTPVFASRPRGYGKDVVLAAHTYAAVKHALLPRVEVSRG